MNPLINHVNSGFNGNGNIESVKGMMKMFRSAGDQSRVIEELASKNPEINQIVQMSNGVLKGLFYNLCRQKGVNPADVLNMLR